MNFSNSILLTEIEMHNIIDALSADTVAEILGDKLKKTCFIKNGLLYTLVDNCIYNKNMCSEENLICLISGYFSHCLNQAHLTNIKISRQKDIKRNITNNSIKGFLPQLKLRLRNDKIKVDYTPYEVHFQNGYIDIKTSEFKQRTDTHFVSNVIRRDYKKSTDAQQKTLLTMIKKVYPNSGDRNVILDILGSVLSWETPKMNYSLYLVGNGSTGKSFIVDTLIKSAMDTYFYELNYDALSNDSKTSKALNTFSERPNILFCCINEADYNSNSNIYKTFCEGSITTTRLYKEGSHHMDHYSLLINLSNELPTFKGDKSSNGIKRRLKALEHQSTFVVDQKDVDESKNIYLRDNHISDKVYPLRDAMVDLLIKHCQKYIETKTVDFNQSESLKDTTGLINDTNDKFKEFIEENLQKTKDNNRLSKKEIFSMFKTANGFHSDRTMLQGFKNAGLIYKRELRGPDGYRGSFIGYKLRDEDENECLIDDDNDDIIKQKDDEIAMLKKKIEELEKQLIITTIKPPKFTPKKINNDELLKVCNKITNNKKGEIIDKVSKLTDFKNSDLIFSDDEDNNDEEEKIKIIKIIKKIKKVKAQDKVKIDTIDFRDVELQSEKDGMTFD